MLDIRRFGPGYRRPAAHNRHVPGDYLTLLLDGDYLGGTAGAIPGRVRA